jgi:large subunit ribosomal protein L10
MIKTKKEKIKIVEQLKKDFKNFKFLIFFSLFKMETKSLEFLRKKLKKEGCKLQLIKKTLVKKAIPEKEINFLEGKTPVAIIFAPKLFSLPIKFLKEILEGKEGPKILGGVYEERVFSEKEILQISELPSEKELLGKLVFTLSSPMQKIPLIFNQILLKLIFALKQIKGQKEKK